MSRPRKPFGSSQPGRLPATMMKVLAAEMSDPARHRRGKQYASDGSVLDIIVERGMVTCEIQGSRSTPYVAQIEVRQGSGMPLRRDLSCVCSCPDDDNWDGHACKHVVATLYTLSNEFLIEPGLLDVWRGEATDVRPDNDDDDNVDDDDSEGDFTPTRGVRRHLSIVRDIDDSTPSPRLIEPEIVDPLAAVLGLPPDTVLPEIPSLDRVELRPPKDKDLAATLRDAMIHLRVEWD